MLNLFIAALLLCVPFVSFCQDGVGIGTTNVPDDAILKIKSLNNDKGVVLPKADATTREDQLSPASDGLIVFDPDEKAFYYYDSAALDWKRLVQENSYGTVPLGGIIMWSGSEVPSGYELCDGGTTNGMEIPDLSGRFIVSGNIGETGGSNALETTNINYIEQPAYTTEPDECKDTAPRLYSFTYEEYCTHPGLGPKTTAKSATDVRASSCAAAQSGYEDHSDGDCVNREFSECTVRNNPEYYKSKTECATGATSLDVVTSTDKVPLYYSLAFIIRVD